MGRMSRLKAVGASAQAAEPIALPMKIDDADRDYLAHLQAQRQALDVAMQHFSLHLAPRYRLSQGDSVQPDGTIVRKG